VSHVIFLLKSKLSLPLEVKDNQLNFDFNRKITWLCPTTFALVTRLNDWRERLYLDACP